MNIFIKTYFGNKAGGLYGGLFELVGVEGLEGMEGWEGL